MINSVATRWQTCPLCNGASSSIHGWPAKTSDYCPACEGKGGKWMITEPAKRVPTDDDKRISGIIDTTPAVIRKSDLVNGVSSRHLCEIFATND